MIVKAYIYYLVQLILVLNDILMIIFYMKEQYTISQRVVAKEQGTGLYVIARGVWLMVAGK